MRKRRERAVFKSLCKQYAQNVDTSGFYGLILDKMKKIKIKDSNIE